MLKIMQNLQLKTRRRQGGFSMIELLVVATLIIILTMIGLVSYSKTLVNSRNARRKADLEVMRQALVLYKLDNGRYPNQQGVHAEAVTIGSSYLQTAPLDPKNDATYFYQYDGTGTCTVAGCTTFTLTARLESSATVYSVNNP